MTLSRSAITLAILMAASTSHADSFMGSLDLSAGSAHFGRDNAVGIFQDGYTFTLAEPGYLLSASAGTAAPDVLNDLDFTSLLITTGAAVTVATFAGNFGTDANEAYWVPSMFLGAGDYRVVIEGINSPGQASYSGNLAISAVPEPQAYALFLAGLAAMGVISGRRRRSATKG